MEPVSIVLFVFAGALLIAALLLYKGETGWLRSFDRAVYKDREEYARFLGKTIAVTALCCALGGVAGLFLGVLGALGIAAAGIIATVIIAAKKSVDYYK